MLEITPHQPDDTYTPEQARAADPKALLQYLFGICQQGIAYFTVQNGDSIANMLAALNGGGFDAIKAKCDCKSCAYQSAYIQAAAPLLIEAIAKAKALADSFTKTELELRESGKVKRKALATLSNECQQLARKGALS